MTYTVHNAAGTTLATSTCPIDANQCARRLSPRHGWLTTRRGDGVVLAVTGAGKKDAGPMLRAARMLNNTIVGKPERRRKRTCEHGAKGYHEWRPHGESLDMLARCEACGILGRRIGLGNWSSVKELRCLCGKHAAQHIPEVGERKTGRVWWCSGCAEGVA